MLGEMLTYRNDSWCLSEGPFALFQRMSDMGYSFIETVDGKKDFSSVQRGDVVVLPAFGATVQEMQLLNDREVQIIDTTCPWVSKVWNAVDNQAKKSHTSIIHGKWSHEETVATASFAGTSHAVSFI